MRIPRKAEGHSWNGTQQLTCDSQVLSWGKKRNKGNFALALQVVEGERAGDDILW